MKISNDQFKKKRRVGGTEIVKDNDWENLRTFHATKIEQKVGLDVEIDIIRTYLNKNNSQLICEICGKKLFIPTMNCRAIKSVLSEKSVAKN